MAFATKQLNFTWAAVGGATYYKIYQNLDGISDFTQVGADTKATVVNIEIAVHRHHWMTACYMVEACNPMGCAASAAVDIASGMLGAIGYSKTVKAVTGSVQPWR